MKSKKIFGKFNLVDMLIVTVLLIIAAVFVFRTLTNDEPEPVYNELHYTVCAQAVPESVYEEILQYIPCQMMTSNGIVDGSSIVSASAKPCTVKEIRKYSSENIYSTAVIEPDENYVDITFELSATADVNDITTKIGTQEVRVGRLHIVKCRFFEISGLITSMEWQQ